MNKFNIVIAATTNQSITIHASCFIEIVQLLQYALQDLGYEVFCAEGLRKDCVNIVLGYQYLEGRPLPKGYKYIVYQLEELADADAWPFMNIIETLKSPCVVWDFCEKNIEFLARQGIKAVYKPLGFHPKMRCINHKSNKDVDILFYGSKNERRNKILSALHNKFKLKILFGIYGQARDAWIARSKIVLSIYYYETKYFDDIRMSYLLNNKVFSIVEDSPHKKYEDFLVYVDYDEIVDACAYYLENGQVRNTIANKSYRAFSEYPEVEFIKKALSEGQNQNL